MKFNKLLSMLVLTSVFSIASCTGPANDNSINSNNSVEPQSVEPSSESKFDHKELFDEMLKDLPIPTEMLQDCDEKGMVEVFEYETKVYNINGEATKTITKKADVYLPYDYDEGKEYNVLYLMHGGGETYTYWLTQQKNTVKVLNNMIAKGIIDPCLVVAPTFYTNDPDNPSSGGTDSAPTDIFQYEFRNDLIPALESFYATYATKDTSPEGLRKTRAHRGFAGLSMGSMTSIRSALLGCLDICGYISSMSGGYDANDSTGQTGFALIEEALTGKFKDYPILYWLNQNGTSDMALTPHENLKDLVLENLSDLLVDEENFAWIKFNRGSHDYTSWLVGMYNTLIVFFR